MLIIKHENLFRLIRFIQLFIFILYLCKFNNLIYLSISHKISVSFLNEDLTQNFLFSTRLLLLYLLLLYLLKTYKNQRKICRNVEKNLLFVIELYNLFLILLDNEADFKMLLCEKRKSKRTFISQLGRLIINLLRFNQFDWISIWT